jgi:hypothetical protein
MPSPQYYIDQARTLLSWAQATSDKAYAAGLRRQAAKQLARTNGARAAIPDLNPILSDFNDRQMTGPDK